MNEITVFPYFDINDRFSLWSGKRGRKIFGSNAYPEPKGTFNSFINALNKLSNSKIEFEDED